MVATIQLESARKAKTNLMKITSHNEGPFCVCVRMNQTETFTIWGIQFNLIQIPWLPLVFFVRATETI